MDDICRPHGIHKNTGWNWLRKRRELGSPGTRRTRKLSDKLGMPSSVTKEDVKMLLSPSRNLVRDQVYEVQIKYFNIGVKPRQLRNRIAKESQGARRYKQVYSKSSFSTSNIEKRRKHGQKYQNKTIDDTYQW
jgi:hypothetical protein